MHSTIQPQQQLEPSDFGGFKKMNERFIRPFVGYMTPSDLPTIPGLFVQFTISGVSGAVVTFTPVEVILALAMLFDYIAGSYAAQRRGIWSYKKGLDGLLRKGIIGSGVLFLKLATVFSGGGDFLLVALTTSLVINEVRSSLTKLRQGRFDVPPLADKILNSFAALNESKIGESGMDPGKKNKE